METSEAETKEEIRLPKISKGNRYYYKNREAILEKKRLARLAKLANKEPEPKESGPRPIEERRLKKMEHLGLLKPQNTPGLEK
jgi:hypothetical protein